MRGGGIWGVLGGRFWGENGEKWVRIGVMGGSKWGEMGEGTPKWGGVAVGDIRRVPKMGGGGHLGGVPVFIMGVLR